MSRTVVPRLAIAVFVVVLVASVVVTVRAVLDTREGNGPRSAAADAAAPGGASLVADRAATRASELVRDWDRRRAQVWAGGEPSRVRELYVPGAAAARRERAMVAAYQRRGLRVEGLRTQVLAVEVLDREPGRWRLRVTDRLAAGTVVAADGSRSALPRDAASVRRVTLRRYGGGWRVAEVTGQSDSPAASTAATSGSEKE